MVVFGAIFLSPLFLCVIAFDFVAIKLLVVDDDDDEWERECGISLQSKFKCFSSYS